MKKRVLYLVLIINFYFIWEFFGSRSPSVRLLISSPGFIVDYIGQNYYDLLSATAVTLIEAFCGLLIATFISFTVMTLVFFKPKIMDYVLPVMVTSQVMPLIVLAPFFVLLLGIGVTSKIAMAAVMCFFPIFVNFAQGYKSISKNILELMNINRASTTFKIINVYYPLSMPNIIAGLKISSTLSVIGAIVAEFTGAQIGLGKNLFLSAIRLNPDLMMSSLLLSTVLGGIMFGAILVLERLTGTWFLHSDEEEK